KAMMVHSANDASIAVAEALGGSTADFADMMNDAAARLGMTASYFVNPNGLPAQAQQASAEDMAKLSRTIVTRFPENYATYCGLDSFTFNGRTYKNSNDMLTRHPYDGLDGGKTGWIRASGYNLAASAVRDNQRLVAVIFGADSIKQRREDMALLLDYGFRQLSLRPAAPAP